MVSKHFLNQGLLGKTKISSQLRKLCLELPKTTNSVKKMRKCNETQVTRSQYVDIRSTTQETNLPKDKSSQIMNFLQECPKGKTIFFANQTKQGVFTAPKPADGTIRTLAAAEEGQRQGRREQRQMDLGRRGCGSHQTPNERWKEGR